MRVRAPYRLYVCLLLAASFMAGADPTGEAILQRFIDRSGGEAAYAKAKTSLMEGTVEVVGRNITGHVTVAEDGPKSWTAMDLAGIGRVEQGYDGETAWEISAIQGPRIIEGDEKDELRRASSLSLPKSWREDYKSIRNLGSEDIDGKPAWKIEMTPKEGKPETYFFDKDSGLLVRTSVVLSSPLGDIPTTGAFSDYRRVDGILTPFTETQEAMGQTIAMHFDTVKYNAPLPLGRFDPPAEIKALLAK